jgi:hypothetical protein
MKTVSIVTIMSFLLALANSLSTAAATAPVPDVVGVEIAPVAAAEEEPFSLLAHASSVAASTNANISVSESPGIAGRTKRKLSGEGQLNKAWLKACEDSEVAKVLSSDCCALDCLKTKANFSTVKTSRLQHLGESASERRQSCREFLDQHHGGDGSKESPHRYWFNLPNQKDLEVRSSAQFHCVCFLSRDIALFVDVSFNEDLIK